MNTLLVVMTVLIVFISIFLALGILSAMATKYNECKEHMFSETPQCNMAELGKTLASGMMLLGILSVVSGGASCILINLALSAKKQYGAFE